MVMVTYIVQKKNLIHSKCTYNTKSTKSYWKIEILFYLPVQRNSKGNFKLYISINILPNVLFLNEKNQQQRTSKIELDNKRKNTQTKFSFYNFFLNKAALRFLWFDHPLLIKGLKCVNKNVCCFFDLSTKNK